MSTKLGRLATISSLALATGLFFSPVVFSAHGGGHHGGHRGHHGGHGHHAGHHGHHGHHGHWRGRGWGYGTGYWYGGRGRGVVVGGRCWVPAHWNRFGQWVPAHNRCR